jgi:sphingosine kinase
MDLCLVARANQPMLYSFIAQAYGLIADADLGTEHLRWMGNKRIYMGYASGVVSNKSYPCDIWLKIVKEDKQAMVEEIKQGSHRIRGGREEADLTSLRLATVEEPLEGKEGWTKLDMEAVGIFYAGKTPW